MKIHSPLSDYIYPIGVIVPTYNRSKSLLSCLEHLEHQTWSDFEVIVVDDGSTDSTAQLIEEYRSHSPLHLRYIRQENSGPARARNVAIAALKSPICLMIGDDIFASPEFVATHLRLHQQRPEMQVAALGVTHWDDREQTITPFMRWLDESGVQFAYNDLLRGARPDWKYFYTSNLSLKTNLLKEEPFDEGFSKAAMEDLELGYRLEVRHHMELVFLPDALAHHLHPTSFLQACRRMLNVGHSTQRFHEVWPDVAPPLRGVSFRKTLRSISVNTPGLLPLLTPIANVLTKVWCPNPLMRYTLLLHCAVGYKSAVVSDQTRRKP